jgi:hypothetical protein
MISAGDFLGFATATSVIDKALGPRWGRIELVRGDSLELCQLTCSEGDVGDPLREVALCTETEEGDNQRSEESTNSVWPATVRQ